MDILNLYAGIGGNRKLWSDEHTITAVEINPKIASIYQDFFSGDTVIVGDAHQYLLDHFKEFDVIWSSPPCPTHSRLNKCFTAGNAKNPITYPDMKLYQEIILLKNFFDGKFIIENVISYYQPLIPPTEMNSHYFWTNFYFMPVNNKFDRGHYSGIDNLQEIKGFDISEYSGIDKIKTLRNCVFPETGKYLLDQAIKSFSKKQMKLL